MMYLAVTRDCQCAGPVVILKAPGYNRRLHPTKEIAQIESIFITLYNNNEFHPISKSINTDHDKGSILTKLMLHMTTEMSLVFVQKQPQSSMCAQNKMNYTISAIKPC